MLNSSLNWTVNVRVRYKVTLCEKYKINVMLQSSERGGGGREGEERMVANILHCTKRHKRKQK